MTDDRCAYTPNVRGDPTLGRVCCWRPVYRDSDRCIWHADTDEKSVTELAERRPHAGERLDCAMLQGLTLIDVDWFTDAVLIGAEFDDANVSGSDFGGADLRKSSFDGASAHGTSFRDANLEGADISSVDLRDADLRMAKVDDTDVAGSRINSKTQLGRRTVYDRLLDEADDWVAKTDALEAAVRTYRQFEELSHDNSLYGQASRYYRRSKDIRRRFNWGEGNYFKALTGEASRLVSGYGNQPWRVVTMALVLMVACGLVYPFLGGLRTTGEQPVVYAIEDPGSMTLPEIVATFVESGFFSIITFSTLGYGTLEPVTSTGRYLAGVESLLGSLVLALLVAVLTRSTWLR